CAPPAKSQHRRRRWRKWIIRSAAACRGRRRFRVRGCSEANNSPGRLNMAAPDQASRTAGWRRLFSRRTLRRAAWASLACALLLTNAWLALPLVPLPRALFTNQAPGVEYLDRTGQPLRVVRPNGSAFRRPVAYGEIPQSVIQATLAAEDRRFWRHPGVDWRATARAAWQLALHPRGVSGGSP